MINEKPFIHLIQSPYGYYVYDVNTNSIIQTPKYIYDYLSKVGKNNTELESELESRAVKEVLAMKEEGLFSSKRPKEIKHTQTDFLEYRLNNKIRKITLQVTQKCNFRCSYCVYSESDNTKQRKHSLKSMSLYDAKRAVDFLINNSIDQKTVNIGFYGGEPLLEFDLIKQCIGYAQDVGLGKHITYSITTNGTLLNDEVIEFFIKHNVDVLISLDGPKEIHDKQRRFAANGCGTFSTIEQNLMKIKDKYPEFFNKIKFNVVIDPQNDYNCLNSLFVDYEIFKDSNVRSSVIDDTYSSQKTVFNEDYTIKREYEIFKAFLSHLNRLDIKKVSPIAMQEIEEIEKIEERLGNQKEVSDITSHSGPCIPGEVRLFINAEGNFYPCERVSELSEVMRIGSLDDGFDIDNAKKLLNVGKLTEDLCKNCWSLLQCGQCAKHADNIKELCAELKKTYCRNTRARTEHYFKNLIMIKEMQSLINQKR